MANEKRPRPTINTGIQGNVSAETLAVGERARASKSVRYSGLNVDELKQVLAQIRTSIATEVPDAKLRADLEKQTTAIGDDIDKARPDEHHVYLSLSLLAEKINLLGETVNNTSRLLKRGGLGENVMTDNILPARDRGDKPQIFIGSSSEGLSIAEHVQLGLDRDADCVIWNQGVFGFGLSILETLVDKAPSFDYAILVLSPDDLVLKRGREGVIPRDNVLFELGLFIGALGRKRTFIVHCRDDQIELPSDLSGISSATFRRRQDGNLSAALGPVCTQIRTIVKRQ